MQILVVWYYIYTLYSYDILDAKIKSTYRWDRIRMKYPVWICILLKPISEVCSIMVEDKNWACRFLPCISKLNIGIIIYKMLLIGIIQKNMHTSAILCVWKLINSAESTPHTTT